jgi:HD-GYP domain-containing protein (c-di-GMP phosphodiesterase class II)
MFFCIQRESIGGSDKMPGKMSILSYSLDKRFKTIYFLISILPLSALAYIVMKYVAPAYITIGRSLFLGGISIIVLLMLFISFLGYIIILRDTKRAMSQAKETAEQFNHLAKASQAMSSAVHLDICLQNIVNSTTELLHAEAGSVFLYDKVRRELHFKILTGEHADKIKDLKLQLGQGVAGWVALKGKPLVVNDVTSDSHFTPEFDQVSGFKTKSIICVPLMLKNEIIGVLEILNKAGNQNFSERDQELLMSLASQAATAINNAELYEAQQNYFVHVTEILVTSLERCELWPHHLTNVAKYSSLIAHRLDLDEEERRNLHFAALLHDVGNLRLSKKASFDLSEAMKHPVMGEKMISPITLWKDIAPLIRCHHEHYDGKGYPDGLKGDEIPLGSRIIGLAEAYDAMANTKSYNWRKNKDEILQELRNEAGKQFDPILVEILLELIQQRPELF